MNTSMKYLILCVCVLMFACTNAFALEFKDMTISAKNTNVRWLFEELNTQGRFSVGPIRPTHVACLHVLSNNQAAFPDFESVLSTPTGQSLSREQKDLMSTGQGIMLLDTKANQATMGKETWALPSGWQPPQLPVPSFNEVLLYAVSYKDANDVVKAYVEALEGMAYARVQEVQQKLKDFDMARARVREKIDRVQTNIQSLVLNQGTATSPEDIGRLVSTIEELRNSLSIDVAGLNARIECITGYIGKADPEGRKRLEQMLIDHNVELAGMLAKLKATDAARQQAKEQYMYSLRLGELRKESDELRAQLMKAEERSREVENAYMQAQREAIHPQIFQNKATIYPVKPEN